MENVRKAMLDGKRLKECASCHRDESMGMQSYRQAKLEQDDPDTSAPDITFVDIKFGNKCNLKCKMCFPHSSSELMKEWWQLGWTVDDPMEGQRADYYDGYMLENYDWPRQRENMDKLLEVTKTIKVLKFTGGEPMINPQMFKFLRHLVDSGAAPTMVLYVTTNCTQIHPRFLELARCFKELHLRLSIDGFGRTYEYIRYPARWDTVMRNIEQYSRWYRQGLVNGRIFVNSVVSVFNLHQMPSLFRRLSEHLDVFCLTDLNKPTFMSWRHAPEDTQKQVTREVLSMVSDPDDRISHAGKEMAAMLQRRYCLPTDTTRRQLREFVSQQDALRGIDIKDYIPHLVDTTRM
jgi:sulfatase maturation enzyme AslB (radical SAM superfamily)